MLPIKISFETVMLVLTNRITWYRDRRNIVAASHFFLPKSQVLFSI